MSNMFTLIILVLLAKAIAHADAHGFLVYPKSRNYYHGVGPQFPSSSNMGGSGDVQNLNAGIGGGPDGMALEKSQGHELCGDTTLLNRFTNPSSPYSTSPVQATFNAGSTVDVKVKITAYHYGWFEFRLCTSSTLTQSCLNQYVLELDETYSKAQYSSNQMARGLLNTLDYVGVATSDYSHQHTLCDNIPYSPKGSCCNGGGACSTPAQNKHRWMLPAPDVDNQEYTIRLKIPSGISCDKCVLQWFYQTGNSIDNYPEAFWNCADVKVVSGGTTPQPTASNPTKSPTSAANPTKPPTKVPTATPNTSTSSNSCSGEPCGDKTMCRSEWGYCGTTDAYCNDKSTWKPSCIGITTSPTTSNPTTKSPMNVSNPTAKPVTPAPSSATGSCSGAPCADTTMCRSEWGYCGTTDAYCNDKSTWKPSCAGITPSPTKATTPTTVSPTNKPVTPAPTAPTNTKSPTTPTSMPATATAFFNKLDSKASNLNSQILLYQTPTSQWVQSSVYFAKDLIAALKVMVQSGVAGKFFYIGEDVGLTPEENAKVGLVGLAAFLAQAKKEAIMYDACDENNWDLIGTKYPLSNACGQLGQSYQDYTGEHACPLDPTMEITATTNAKWYGAPGPFFCGPKSKTGSTGYWDYSYNCNNPLKNPPETCNVYPGQQAGRYDNTSPVANRLGRTDVENCCWWGRGVIQTTGRGNYGDLNYYLGKGAASRGAVAAFPDVDFCKTPDAVCASSKYPELKWVAGLFYWMNSVQTYNAGGWNYITKLKEYVANGIQSPGTDANFIAAISGIVNRGCHNPPCASGPVDGGSDRAKNFEQTLKALGVIN